MSPSDRPRSPRPTVDEPIAVVGATGEQGGAVARSLLARGTPVRAIVRDPDAERAQALVAAGAQLVVADLTDESSLRAAFDGAPAVFAMASPTPDGGVEAEAEHGKSIARAAAAIAVPHVVYSSVGGVERNSGIPHFESKLEVEQTLLELGMPCTFIRPVFFMDNFVRFMAPAEEDGTIVLRLPMPGDVPLQMIAVVDVAAVSAVALLEPGRLRRHPRARPPSPHVRPVAEDRHLSAIVDPEEHRTMCNRPHLPASVISAKDAPAFWCVGILCEGDETARALNFYTPGGIDESISMLATPAAAKTLPPADSGENDPRGFRTDPAKEDAYRRRISELRSQSMP